MTDDTFSAQASALVSDNRRLRVKSEADDRTITMLKAQYAELADDFKLFQQRCREREHELITERDKAACRHTEIEGLLNQAADLIIQAMARRTAVVPTPSYDPEPLKIISED